MSAAADLEWWLTLAPTLEWTWATTFAGSAPHWYVHLGKTPGLTRDDFIRAGRVIRTYGEPGRFYRLTNLYLHTDDRARKFWVMWGSPPQPIDARTINLALTDRSYGPQRDFDPVRVFELTLPIGPDPLPARDPGSSEGRKAR